MNNTWILVAHRAGARIFEITGGNVKFLESIPHPEGRLKNVDINSDKPGRAFDKFGGGRHSMEKEHEPTEQQAIQFAKHLGDMLEKGRTTNRFNKLVLVAEPRFLGELRAALPSHTASLVTNTVEKDYAGLSDREVAGHLERETYA